MNNTLLIKTLVLLSLSITLLAGCTVKNKINQSEDVMVNSTNSISDIDGKWQLDTFHRGNIKIDDTNQSFIPILKIEVNENKIGGRDGCNNIFAKLSKLTTSEIEIGQIAGTKMGCKMDTPYDTDFKFALRDARTYSIDGSKLILFDKDKNKLLEFNKI